MLIMNPYWNNNGLFRKDHWNPLNILVSELPRPAPFTTPVPQPGHPNDVAFGGESVVGSPRARAAAVFMASTHLRNNWKLALPTSSKITHNWWSHNWWFQPIWKKNTHYSNCIDIFPWKKINPTYQYSTVESFYPPIFLEILRIFRCPILATGWETVGL